MLDDIQKDFSVHTYEWRMHTLSTNAIDATANPIRIAANSGTLDIYPLNPLRTSLSVAVSPFDNQEIDPNSLVLRLSIDAERPRFALLMIPLPTNAPRPTVTIEALSWGTGTVVDWGGGVEDLIVLNRSAGEIVYAPAGGDTLRTDAAFAHIRLREGAITRYLAHEVSALEYAGRRHVEVRDGTVNVARDSEAVRIDREDAVFVFFAPNLDTVFYRDTPVPTSKSGGFVRPARRRDRTAVAPGFMRVTASPNPFNPNTTVFVQTGAQADVDVRIYDVRGELVRKLWRGRVSSNGIEIDWNGRDGNGSTAATGVYFVVARTSATQRVTKVVLIR